MHNYKIGFACQVGSVVKDTFKQLPDTTIGTVTVSGIIKLSDSAQYDKLVSKVKQNLRALSLQIAYVSKLPQHLRMFRISSNLLPLVDHPELGQLYDAQLWQLIEYNLGNIRQTIQQHNIRISLHPSQYTVLNSESNQTITNSIRTLNFQYKILELLGKPADSVINIHFNGRLDTLPVNEISDFKQYLSLENDEKTGNLDRVLKACQQHNVRYVLDLHHYFCNTGSYLGVNDYRLDSIIETWDGIRPKLHLSQARDLLGSKRDIWAHSDTITDKELVKYTAQFLDRFDVMIEAKNKNLASVDFYNLLSEIKS